MKVVELKNLLKKDIPLHYRNEYSAHAVLETKHNSTMEKKVEFSLERNAIGNLDIQVQILDDLEYPLLPVIKTLKDYIFDMEKKGDLR